MEGLLLGLGFIGVAVAILTPFVKSGAIMTLASLAVYFNVVGLETWLPVVLFTAGLLLIILEVFIPDFGLVGITGIVLLVSGLYLTIGDLNQTVRDLSLSVVITAGLIIYLVRHGYSLTNVNKLILHNDAPKTEQVEKTEKHAIHAGMKGEAATPLRPSGKATFEEDSHLFDVLSIDGHILKGTSIVVDAVKGTKITVKKINRR